MCLRILFLWSMTLLKIQNEKDPNIVSTLFGSNDQLSCLQDPDIVQSILVMSDHLKKSISTYAYKHYSYVIRRDFPNRLFGDDSG
jgi:hypothetical protein